MYSCAPFGRLTLLAGLLRVCSVYAQDIIILKNGTDIQAKVLEVAPGQLKYRRQDNPDGPIYTTGTADVLLIKYANGTKDVLGQSAPVAPGRPATPLPPSASGSGSTPSNPALSRLSYHHGLLSRYFTDGTGERLAPSTTHSLLASQPDAWQAYRRGQARRRWTTLAAGAAVVLTGAGATVALLGEGGRNGGDRRDGTTSSTTDKDGRTGTDQRGGHESAAVRLALTGGGALLGVAAILLNHQTNVQFRRAADRYNRNQQPATSLQAGPSPRWLGVRLVYTF